MMALLKPFDREKQAGPCLLAVSKSVSAEILLL